MINPLHFFCSFNKGKDKKGISHSPCHSRALVPFLLMLGPDYFTIRCTC